MNHIRIIEFELQGNEIDLIDRTDVSRAEIKGNLHFQVQKPTKLASIIIKLQGECLMVLNKPSPVERTSPAGTSSPSAKCHLVNSSNDILDEQKEFTTGTHVVPFSFNLRNDLPSSQEYNFADGSISITYKLSAVMQPPTNTLTKLVRSVSNSRAVAESFRTVNIKRFTAPSTTSLFPIKMAGYQGTTDQDVDYVFKIPEMVIASQQRLRIKGSLESNDEKCVIESVTTEIVERKTISLVSRDPLRPSTYAMHLGYKPLIETRVLGDCTYRTGPQLGQAIKLDYEVGFRSEDTIPPFTSPMLDIDHYLNVRIAFASYHSDALLKLPIQIATIQEWGGSPLSPQFSEQSPTSYKRGPWSPNYDRVSISATVSQ
ncbi:hypothetical protein INT43_002962 [Umbelopsis isabellina]|uniref:Arrestin-like N-terminal domain-containing protein n=1 Tax=Mortierella isabellina TaxID=91625 RepID=A0A8H7PCV1_MORIS|nr:hypothetical protein INT43_002962 [Umbelopsis isabellina]